MIAARRAQKAKLARKMRPEYMLKKMQRKEVLCMGVVYVATFLWSLEEVIETRSWDADRNYILRGNLLKISLRSCHFHLQPGTVESSQKASTAGADLIDTYDCDSFFGF